MERSLDELLPHRAPARLLTRVWRIDDSTVAGEGQVPHSHALVVDGEAPAFVALELAAQAAAAMEAPAGAGAAVVGYLVGVRDAHFSARSVETDSVLRVEVRRVGEAPPLSIHLVRVEDAEGAEVVTAKLSTYRAGE